MSDDLLEQTEHVRRLLRRNYELRQELREIKKRQQRCVFCGTPTLSKTRTCTNHRDLAE